MLIIVVFSEVGTKLTFDSDVSWKSSRPGRKVTGLCRTVTVVFGIVVSGKLFGS